MQNQNLAKKIWCKWFVLVVSVSSKSFQNLGTFACCLVPGAMSAKGLQNLRGAPLRAVLFRCWKSTFSWKNYPNDVPRRDIVGWKRERWRTMAYYKQNHTSKETRKQSHGDLKTLRYSNICMSWILLHPGRLTWNIIIGVWKIIFLSKWVICRFHVNLPGCRF